MSSDERYSHVFQGTVITLAAATMQHLGKTLNPATQKIEQNMEAAQATIDMLEMLEHKTKGNLSDDEQKLLKGVLGDLKLNYVETLGELEKAKAGAPGADAEGADAAKAEDAAPGGGEGNGDEADGGGGESAEDVEA